MNLNWTARAALAAGLLVAATGALAQPNTLKIVATTTQASDLTRILTVGVDSVQITGLMGAGVDPHLYQPTESDIAAMNVADMVVFSGLNLEGQMGTVLNALSEQGVDVIALSQPVREAGFTIGGFDLSDEFTNVDDPHFWFDPRNWQMSTQWLADALSEADPANADTYQANAEAYIASLDALFAWADEGLRSVPEGQRYHVTSHDAFQYFGSAFGWQMEAIQGISTEDEAGVADIQNVVDFVVTHDVPVIFIESSVPPNTVRAVIEAVEAEGGQLRLSIRELYSDAMGVPGTFGGTYVGMLAENVLTILQSYQCAGIEVLIPEWPETLEPAVPEDMLTPECAA